MFWATFQQRKNKESDFAQEQTLHLLLYDTTQPIDSCTGLPPVKASLTATTSTTRKKKSTGTVQQKAQAELTREQVDSTAELRKIVSKVQHSDSISLAAKNDTTKSVKKGSSGGLKLWIIKIAIACGFGLYLYRKLKR